MLVVLTHSLSRTYQSGSEGDVCKRGKSFNKLAFTIKWHVTHLPPEWDTLCAVTPHGL